MLCNLGNKHLKSRHGTVGDESNLDRQSMNQKHKTIYAYKTSDQTCVNVTTRLKEVSC